MERRRGRGLTESERSPSIHTLTTYLVDFARDFASVKFCRRIDAFSVLREVGMYVICRRLFHRGNKTSVCEQPAGWLARAPAMGRMDTP